MSKRQVRFSDDAEDNLGEPQPHRCKEENSVDSDEDNSNDRKTTPSENVLTEDDIEGLLFVVL